MCAPSPPNPQATAAAQTTSNVDTAKAQAQLNATNQVTPYGNLTYTSTPGAGGIPQYTATQSLSSVGQALFDSNSKTQQNLADLGVTQSERLGEVLSQPFSLDNDAVEGRLMELGSKRLDPLLAKRRETEEQRLADRGIRLGSDAYSSAQSDISQGENDAYNQLLLTGRSQAVNEALTARNQPINEILGVASGTQVQQPSFTSTPQTGVGGTDVAGITNDAYKGNLAAHEQNMGVLGGLFDAGATLLKFSDRRLKKNVKATGMMMGGVPVKTWEWKKTGERDVGVIAQEVEKVHPEMVDSTHETGFKRVDYGALAGAV